MKHRQGPSHLDFPIFTWHVIEDISGNFPGLALWFMLYTIGAMITR